MFSFFNSFFSVFELPSDPVYNNPPFERESERPRKKKASTNNDDEKLPEVAQAYPMLEATETIAP